MYSLDTPNFLLRYPDSSFTESLQVDVLLGPTLLTALLDTGFRKVPGNSWEYHTLLPCPLGTFSNSEEDQGCTECSPGISTRLSRFMAS